MAQSIIELDDTFGRGVAFHQDGEVVLMTTRLNVKPVTACNCRDFMIDGICAHLTGTELGALVLRAFTRAQWDEIIEAMK